jgi:hypothetical protein
VAGDQQRKVKELPAFKVAESRAETASKAARAVPEEIASDATLEQAAEALGIISSARRGIEAQRKLATGPVRQEEADINTEFKELASPINAAEERIKGAILTYQTAQRDKAEKERQRQARLADERQKREDKRAEKEERTPVEHVAPPVTTPPKTVRTSSGAKVSVKENWTFEVVNAAAVPKEFRIDEPDTVAIGKAVRGGTREIPGVRIYDAGSVSAS